MVDSECSLRILPLYHHIMGGQMAAHVLFKATGKRMEWLQRKI